MLTADTKLISVDDHVIEPPQVFVDHIAPRYRARAPRVIEPEPGVQGTVALIWMVPRAVEPSSP
jgi:hypothetical protein